MCRGIRPSSPAPRKSGFCTPTRPVEAAWEDLMELYTDETGREIDEVVRGWPARIVAHESDHLAGTLYIDRAHTRSLTTTEQYSALWSDPGPERAARVLGFGADAPSEPPDGRR